MKLIFECVDTFVANKVLAWIYLQELCPAWLVTDLQGVTRREGEFMLPVSGKMQCGVCKRRGDSLRS